MQFKKYPKIHRFGKEETEGMLEGNPFVVIQEKIDGANTSIWLDKDGVVQCGSRTRQLPRDESFRGFTEWARNQESIVSYLTQNPTHTLYGEWLVRHTIQYPETAYQKWYLFDIYDNDYDNSGEGAFIDPSFVETISEEYGFNHPTIFGAGELTEADIREFVGKSEIGNQGEGVVIKRPYWTNKFGDHCYAKIVTQKFQENNAVTFGGNNKHSETYQEMYFVNKYCTLSRVQKIMNKIQPEVDKRLDMEHIPRISNTCYHDMITEESWEIASSGKKVDFSQLKRLATKKFIQIYRDILTGDISIADKEEK